MQREELYGTLNRINSNDGYASGEPNFSTYGLEEDQKITTEEKPKNISEFNQSSRRIDVYHLYFSSKL